MVGMKMRQKECLNGIGIEAALLHAKLHLLEGIAAVYQEGPAFEGENVAVAAASASEYRIPDHKTSLNKTKGTPKDALLLAAKGHDPLTDRI